MTVSRLPCLALLTLLLGLVGCSSTVFESLPTGTTTDCDPMKPQGVVEIAVEPLMVLRHVRADALRSAPATPAARED